MRHLSSRSRAWLFGLSLALGLVILDVFLDGPLVNLDRWVIQYDGQQQDPWLDPVAQAYDKLGQRSVGIPILLIVAAMLARRHRTWRPVLLAIYTVVSLNLVVGAMKVLIGRSETETGATDVFAGGTIFPSGHSSNMVLTGGLIIYLVRKYSNNPPTRRLVVALAVLTTLTIATSIYIGSHWVTDLIGGALVGGLLLQAVIVIDRATTSPQTRHPAAPVIEVPGQSGRSSTAGDGAAAALARGRSAEVVEDVTDVLPASSASEARRTRAD